MELNKVVDRAVDQELFWHVPSKYIHQNIFQYSYFRIDAQSEVTTPASVGTIIVFVMGGGCYYEGKEVKRGDVFLYGMHKNPITSFSTDIELFTIDVSYVFLYKKFGLTPQMYYDKVLCLPQEHIFCKFAKRLLEVPMGQWVEFAEDFMEKLLLEQPEDSTLGYYECVIQVVRDLLHNGYMDDTDCCRRFGISKRQLQRQFVRFFGVTMRDYERLVRFSKALCGLDENSLVNTAMYVGYYDQSHMNREFKEMAGTSPQQITQYVMYTPIKEGLKNLVKSAWKLRFEKKEQCK